LFCVWRSMPQVVHGSLECSRVSAECVEGWRVKEKDFDHQVHLSFCTLSHLFSPFVQKLSLLVEFCVLLWRLAQKEKENQSKLFPKQQLRQQEGVFLKQKKEGLVQEIQETKKFFLFSEFLLPFLLFSHSRKRVSCVTMKMKMGVLESLMDQDDISNNSKDQEFPS